MRAAFLITINKPQTQAPEVAGIRSVLTSIQPIKPLCLKQLMARPKRNLQQCLNRKYCAYIHFTHSTFCISIRMGSYHTNLESKKFNAYEVANNSFRL